MVLQGGRRREVLLSRRGVAPLLSGAPLALAACAGPAARTTRAELRLARPTSVSILTNGTFAGPGADTLREAVEQILKPAQPNLSVVFEAAGVSGVEYRAKILSLAVAGTLPDVIYAGLADMPALAKRSILRPLDDLLRADHAFKADDFFPVHWNAWRFQDKQQGLPWQGGPLVTYYNRDLLEGAGVPAPTEASWTWEAWRDAGARLKRTMAAEDGRWPTEVGPWQHWVYAAGAGVLDQAMTRCVLDTPQGLTAFQTMTDFVHRDQIAPKPPDVAGKTNAQLFMDGRLAVIIMNRQGSSVEGFVRPHVTIAPLPKGPAGRFSQSPFDGFGLAATTREPVASWEVLKFRTGDALRRLLHGRGLGGIPALKATAASPEYLNERLPTVWNQFFVDNMATVRLAPPTPAWPDVETTISQTVQQMRRGEVAPPAALHDLAPRVTALL